MRQRLRAGAVLAVFGAACMLACSGERITRPAPGHAVILLRSTQLAVNDTVTVRAGVLFDDGRFSDFTGSGIAMRTLDATVASLNPTSHLLRALKSGTTTVEVTLQSTTTVTLDTTIVVR